MPGPNQPFGATHYEDKLVRELNNLVENIFANIDGLSDRAETLAAIFGEKVSVRDFGELEVAEYAEKKE